MSTEVSIEGIIQSGERLLNSSETLSKLFEVVEEVTGSINSNMSGFDEVEQLIDLLKNINLTKDKLISKINEFANYLLNTIVPGYENFMKEIGQIEMDTSFFANLETLFGVTFERIAYNSTGLVEGGETISQAKPITNEETTVEVTEVASPLELKKTIPRKIPITKDPRGPVYEVPRDPNPPVEY